MKSILFVADLDKETYVYHVKVTRLVINRAAAATEPVQVFHASPEYFIGYFLDHLHHDTLFRVRVRQVLKSRDRVPAVELTSPRYSIDMKSSIMSLKKAHEYVELIEMLSWFSTFGGAYSNLGDEFTKCAEMAGKISVTQMRLAFQLGDPFLISRCKLYFCISLIQRGYINAAKQIVRSQYKFAQQEEEADPKLKKMCLGIWSKLVYTKQLLVTNKCA